MQAFNGAFKRVLNEMQMFQLAYVQRNKRNSCRLRIFSIFEIPKQNEMNLKDIEALIKFVQKTGVSEVSIEQKDLKLTIKTHPAAQPVIQATMSAAPAVMSAPPMAPQSMLTPAHPGSSAPAVAEPQKPKTSDESRYVTIKSPMIGTFYRSSSPDKPAFVNVGDEIKQGKVICIIEAMKLFNEIESEVSGKIVKVLVDNSSPVEYDQPLFLVDPS